MKSSRSLLQTSENIARVLTICTFVLLCWVAHRALQWRTDCVNSSFLSLVLLDGEKLYNCRYESRLNIGYLFSPISYQTQNTLRVLEGLEPLAGVLPVDGPNLVVEIVDHEPRFLELTRNYLRLGREWLSETHQLRQALILGVLNALNPQDEALTNERQILSSFLNLAVYRSHQWLTEQGQPYSVDAVQFPVVAPWGMDSLIAVGLWKVFERLPMSEKIMALARLRQGAWPESQKVVRRGPANVTKTVEQFESSLRNHLSALGMSSETAEWALKRTLKELHVESPTRWELTVDITETPAWREILVQIKQWMRFRPRERAVVFTPEGAIALPSELPVTWRASDIRSQKHVMIACPMPNSKHPVRIEARQLFAQESCNKLMQAFWN